MNNTVMPAFRLTASCIWNSFQSSGKRHLLLIGNRGSGKTTLLSQLCPEPLPGITTWAEPRKAAYLKNNISKEYCQIGIYDERLPGTENKMVPYKEGFWHLGLQTLQQCILSESEWISIDEIGYLEASVPEYINEIRNLMRHKRLLAILRRQELPFLRELQQREDVFLVDLDNPFGNQGCVIMASGLSKRFGSNKLLADFHGEPLLCRILSATNHIFAKRIVITRHEEVVSICKEKGIDVICHNLPYRSDTVRLGVNALGDVDRCIFCPSDQPLLHRETVAALALAGRNDSRFIWRTSFDNICGAPVSFPKWTYPELLALPDGNGGSFVIKKYPKQIRLVSAQNIYELKDIDSPLDLEELLGQ